VTFGAYITTLPCMFVASHFSESACNSKVMHNVMHYNSKAVTL